MIISGLKESNLEKILLEKFKEFINFNSDKLDKSDTNFYFIINELNNIEYDGIPDDIILIIDKVKSRLLTLLISSRDDIIINGELQRTTKISPGIDLVNSYNFYDLLDNCKEFDKKITGIKPGSGTSDLENQLTKVNNIILRNKDTTWYLMLIEIVNLRRLILRAGTKLGYETTSFDLASYLVDIFIGFRINQEVDVPFNINLITHSYNDLRNLNGLAPSIRRGIDSIYNFLFEDFIIFSMGPYSRGTSDCGEAVLLNLINYLIWDDTSKSLRHDWLPDNTIESLKEFFIKYKKLDTIKNRNVRSNFNEILYGFDFILQNNDYCGHENYKVYSVPTIIEHVDYIYNEAIANTNFIFDEMGKLLPGKKAISYTGWRIRPGYISFIRLCNVLFGFNKTSNKYNEEFVMRNVTTNSLKEILLTFKNPNIIKILSNYKILTGLENFNTKSDISLNFKDFTMNLEWWHGIVNINGKFEAYVHDDILGTLNDTNLRHNPAPLTIGGLHSIENNPVNMIFYNIEMLREQIEVTFNSLLRDGREISDTLINIYKTILTLEQRYFVLNRLPPNDYFNVCPMSKNYFFTTLDGKIKLSKDIFRSSLESISLPIMDMIIKLNDNNIDKVLDGYGNRLIHFLIPKNLKLMILFEHALEKNADYNLCDLFGNNIIHMCKRSANVIETIIKIKEIMKRITGNNQAFNKLLISKNNSGYYPVINLLRRANLIDPILFPENENELFDIFINGVTKLYTNSNTKTKFTKFFEVLTQIILNKIPLGQHYRNMLINIFRFIISLSLKNRIYIDYLYCSN